MKEKKIAFIKRGSFSYTNTSLISVFKSIFPQYSLDIIDVDELVKSYPVKRILSKLSIYREFCADILSKKKSYAFCRNQSSFLYDFIKHQLHHRISPREYVFSFQTQSLFDGSVNQVPHFVYTDHTALANLRYPDLDCSYIEERYSPNWLSRERKIYHNASCVFTMGNFVRQSLIEDYGLPAHKVCCVGVGSNASAINNLRFEKYQSKNILFVGVDWERKGGPELIEAFRKIVLPKHPDAKLTIVGCSPQVNIPNCHVIGRIPLEEVPEYYQNAAVFCLPSRREPFGVVFIEALLNSLPVVATNIGAIPDVVLHGDNGYLTSPGDIAEIGKFLNILIGSPSKCAAFGANGKIYVTENYTWTQVGQRIEEKIKDHIISHIL